MFYNFFPPVGIKKEEKWECSLLSIHPERRGTCLLGHHFSSTSTVLNRVAKILLAERIQETLTEEMFNIIKMYKNYIWNSFSFKWQVSIWRTCHGKGVALILKISLWSTAKENSFRSFNPKLYCSLLELGIAMNEDSLTQ